MFENAIVKRIAGDIELDLVVVPQDIHLSKNQSEKVRCGDNGIFKGVPLTIEQKHLSKIARFIYKIYPTFHKKKTHIRSKTCLQYAYQTM